MRDKTVKKEVPTKSEPEDVGEFTLDPITSKGDTMKMAIKQKFIFKREEAIKFFEQLRVKYKSILDTLLQDLALQSLEEPSVHPTLLPTIKTNGNKPNLRNRCKAFTAQTDLQSQKRKILGDFNRPKPSIMPKVKPHASSIVFRRPRKGECIMSTNGSPTLCNTASSVTTTLNIPMSNGNMMSILPVLEHHPAPLPSAIDPETKAQLKTLCGHLKTFMDKLD